jgi:hypothetical protein
VGVPSGGNHGIRAAQRHHFTVKGGHDTHCGRPVVEVHTAAGTVATRGLPGGRAMRHSAQEATSEVTGAAGEEKTEGR